MGDLRSSLFGSLAVGAGLCAREQVEECLQLQEKYRARGGRVPRLGELLASKGYLSVEQVRTILQGTLTEPGKKFGELCVEMRFCTPEQINRALEEQGGLDSSAQGHRRLGDILLEKGNLRREQLPPILQAQGVEIVECTKCRQSFNIQASAPEEARTCPRCGRGLIAVMGYEDVTAVAEEIVEEPAEEPAEELVVEEVPVEEEEREYGGFVTQETLGSDAQGTLYKARHKQTGQTVALKLYDVSRSRNEEFVKRFVEQARRAMGLDHPKLKKVAGAGKDKGQLYHASEFVEGKSLRRLIEEQGRVPTRVATHIIKQVAEALKHAHGKGLVHGEIRPSNVIVTHEGKVKLAGLGAARDPKENVLFLARAQGEVPLYMAPEQGAEGRTVDHRADVYSLGSTWYHMVCGSPPFKGNAPIEVLMRMAEEEPRRPDAVEPKVSKPIADIIMKMMAIEPDERYQSTQALLLDVDKVAAFETGKFEMAKELAFPKEEAKPEGGEVRRRSRKRRRPPAASSPRQARAPSREMRPSGRVTRVAESPRGERERPSRGPKQARSSAAAGWLAAGLILLAGVALVVAIIYYGRGEPEEEERRVAPTTRPAPAVERPAPEHRRTTAEEETRPAAPRSSLFGLDRPIDEMPPERRDGP